MNLWDLSDMFKTTWLSITTCSAEEQRVSICLSSVGDFGSTNKTYSYYKTEVCIAGPPPLRFNICALPTHITHVENLFTSLKDQCRPTAWTLTRASTSPWLTMPSFARRRTTSRSRCTSACREIPSTSRQARACSPSNASISNSTE